MIQKLITLYKQLSFSHFNCFALYTYFYILMIKLNDEIKLDTIRLL